MLRWMLEIGRVNIITDLSMMASQMAMPKEGYLKAVLRLFVFLCQKYNSKMSFDLTYTTINTSDFKEWKWKDFYGELNESQTSLLL